MVWYDFYTAWFVLMAQISGTSRSFVGHYLLRRSIMDDFESFKVQYSAREADLRTKYENTIQEMGLQHEEIKTKLEESVSKEKDLFQQMQEELHRDFKVAWIWP
ncbi:unnamed protein product [Heterobilharzia americana]|nr:unnamed protein product [Heterobilharzia americana]